MPVYSLFIDDLGWNDLSLHGGCEYSTPNLDSLAAEGLQLNNYYVQHMCTPSRHALMTGRYPISDGMQQNTIGISQPFGMPLDLVTLPEMLKTAGYRTHMLGKWHLGYCLWDYTPLRRGFDTHLGFYGGGEDYFMKNKTDDSSGVTGFDFRDQTKAIRDDTYSTYLYGNETMRLLQDYVADDTEDPFFIYFSSQAVHGPWTAPESLWKSFESSISEVKRWKLAAVATALDDTVSRIVDYMKSEESGYLWDDTLFIVSSDNGGPTSMGASNFPLRGGKMTLWEGGVRTIAWVTGGLLPEDRRGQSMDALMHISDWFPTLCSFTGIDYVKDGVQELDGFNQLDNILYGETDPYAPREVLLHNIQPNDCDDSICGAIRWRNYKLIIGNEVGSLSSNQWYQGGYADSHRTTSDDEITIQCSEEMGFNSPDITNESCAFNGYACLFDIALDPCEYSDLRESEPVIYDKLYQLLVEYNASQRMPTLYSMHESDYNGANPKLYNGFWSPWKEVEPEEELLMEEGMDRIGMTQSGIGMERSLICGVVLVIAAFAIKVLYDVWVQRRSYKEIGDRNESGGRLSI